MKTREQYPPHLQRAIDEAERTQQRGRIEFENGSTVFIETPKEKIRGYKIIDADPPIALGTLVAPKYRSDLERRYADEVLEPERLAGEILGWWYEPMTLHLGGGVKYKPDFGVLPKSREYRFIETKGFWREAARARIKLAASIFPFPFTAIQWDKDRELWTEERF